MKGYPDLRVALVGYGLSGAVFHAPLIEASPGLRLATVVTGNPERAAQARHDIPHVGVLERPDELWERAAGHDLVVVASPTGTHLEVGLGSLQAGLPIVVDKPLAPTRDEARQLVDAADDRGLMLSVFHNRRWDGDTLTIKRLVSDVALGAVTRFESRFERWRPVVRDGAWRERSSAAEGGGTMLDLGSHVIDQALYLFGPALGVYGEVDALRPGAVADDDTFVALHHAGGVRSHLWASAVAAIAGPRVRVLGLGGGYQKYGLDPQEDALRAGQRPDDPNWGVDPPENWGRLVTEAGERLLETDRGAWPHYYAGIVDSLRTGAPPPVTGADGLAVVEVMEAARQSSASGELVIL